MMKKEDSMLYREIQKNTHMGLEAIDAIVPRTKEEKLINQLQKQATKYSELYDKATQRLAKDKERNYVNKRMTDVMLRSGVYMNTMHDKSSSRISELMIRGANMGVTDMYKVLNHNEQASEPAKDLSKELMDFEEKTINTLRGYL
ncbi:MAG: hypothetical protein R3Y47_06285 [Lachnospiraceae bacterium]